MKSSHRYIMSSANSLSRSRPILEHLCSSKLTTRCASTSGKAVETRSKLEPVNYPPEHPKFIHVPQPLQPQAKFTPLLKGVLPKPRKIFDSQRVDKASEEYIASATPQSVKKQQITHLPAEEREYVTYKARQSVQRRKNLREGLTSLRERKTTTDAGIATRSAQKQRDYERRTSAPEPDHEFLTKPTILEALTGSQHILPDPRLPQIIAERKARYAVTAQAKMDERRSALHTLYINAKDFIVTEKGLEDKIVAEFENPSYVRNPTRGVWDIEGIPHTTQELLAGRDVETTAIGKNSRSSRITDERIKRIAEELTGGKIETST
jgi:hypothetical protein